MAEKFEYLYFNDVDLNDSFFDSLKDDYGEFSNWFCKKIENEEKAFVLKDDSGIAAFLYLKDENEEIVLTNSILPKMNRIKIGTLKLSERIQKQRLGEGAIGISLWNWQKSNAEEIYVTIFEKHNDLISLFEKFGFVCKGYNRRGEKVYSRSKNEIDYSTPYTCFPYIKNDFTNAGLLPIEEVFHDKLFPYSELYRNGIEVDSVVAGNGISKVYVATPYSNTVYKKGMPVFVYRIFGGEGKMYKSVVTSYCTITSIDVVKENGRALMSEEEYLQKIGNKSVFNKSDLEYYYLRENLVVIGLVYNGYFGKGHNINCKKLKENGFFNAHPYKTVYNREEFKEILKLGDVDVQNTLID